MKQLGVDLGDRRCGIAVCDKDELLATPHATLEVRGLKDAAAQIGELCRKLCVEQIVVGLPLKTDGKRGERAERVLAFCDLIRPQVQIPIVTWDERFTTVEAYGYLHQSGKSVKEGRAHVDELAATLILQSYLDAQKQKKA